jgi:hypothetical protein
VGEPLPRIDAHGVTCLAAPEVAFDALWHVVRRSFDGRAASTYARAVRCEPSASSATSTPVVGSTTLVGFAVTAVERPSTLTIAGRHHFARYELAFRVEPAHGGGSRIEATTYADFPGRLGALYRALVLGTRIHVLVTRRMLRGVARAADRRAREQPTDIT